VLKNALNRLISNEEPELYHEGIEEDFHGAYRADPSDVFKTDVKTYIFIFYDMQSKFQNKVALPEKTRAVHFITSLNIFSVLLL
jgi:hypothetical protein